LKDIIMVVPRTRNHHAVIPSNTTEAMKIADFDDTPSVVAANENSNDNGNCSDSDTSSSSYDAFDEVFKQGEYLKKLRLMELEDEALRERDRELEEESEEESTSDTLIYKIFLQNQEGKHDDYKHVNYQYIDFGVIGTPHYSSDKTYTDSGRSLIVEQDRTVGKGGLIWDAGYILADSVLRMEGGGTKWLGVGNKTKIIELGAGTGITSLLIAATHPSTTVHLTDLPQLQPLLQKNSQRCCPKNVTCGVLEWGKKPSGEDVTPPYDIILGADVVASIYDSSGLAKTIYDLSHESTVIYLAVKDRLTGIFDRFEWSMKELFTMVERREADSDNKNPDVFILRVSGKRIYN